MKNEKFPINKNIYRNILNSKNKLGFEKKSWDDYLNFLSQSFGKIQTENTLEKKIEKVFYEKSFEKIVQNFAFNLEYIWKEDSAKVLFEPRKLANNEKKSAIVIGIGPSLAKNKHLELLADSHYDGSIVCCDGALIPSLKRGVTPDKFPNFYVVSIDPHGIIRKCYDDPIVRKYGNKIKGIFSTVIEPSTVELARNAGIKIHWLHTLFDYNEGKKSFNQISSLMVKIKNHFNGLPAIQTGGNIGTSSWFVSWRILHCSIIALIGINHGWEEDDSWDLIMSHGENPTHIDIDKNNSEFKKLFPTIYNPDFKCNCILDPIFLYYSNAFKEFIKMSPNWLTTINATEGGSIFGEKIKSMYFKDFLKLYK